MTAVEASSFPSVFKEGWLRFNKRVPFLSGADGVVSKFQQNKVRYADIYKEATRPFNNHPVCAARNGIFLINGAATPPLKRRGMGPSRHQPYSPFQRPLKTWNALLLKTCVRRKITSPVVALCSLINQLLTGRALI